MRDNELDEPLELVDAVDELAELGVDDAAPEDGDNEGDVEILLEGEEAAPETPAVEQSSVINTLRKRLREQGKELAARRAVEPVQREQDLPPIPAKPTLADFDYDEDAHALAVDQRAELVAAHKLADARRNAQIQAAQDTFNERQRQYVARSAKLRVPDFEDAQDEVRGTLSVLQQNILLEYMGDKDALVAYALGKRPGKLAEMSKIADPGRFLLALHDFSKDIKMTPKRTAPPPETIVRGNASAAPRGPDKHLDRLEAEFERTGDRTKILAYKREVASRAAR